ncbi:phenylalanine--tRNA ligase subunit beta [Pseudoblastomonas halimionae]|uniref:Phenylalanine--tRNA ligase beta subunit n=1 Tax=Alteriqipengyuania halimionae TaxID=1926630 RepID=A0A6I4U6G1_9SPHN|nr:phenylalanine--tRNA ligase subunit beta [Alteriqipengyuania halimionae]MXP10994.1 phenylalanine--tRNA ligase subunit beta [Alteriqipengyuania halimionae]
MKFSLEWLKYYLDTETSAAEIADTLNAIGLEVEGVEDPAERLAGFRVAEVLTAEKHPDADKLQVLTVDTGEGDPLQVVCGAPNARAGMKGVLGLPGAVVPANGMELRKSAIRGVESNGMMCSVRELELGDEHDGIIELPGDAPVGESFADYSDSSPIFDVAITPNRPDCMGVMGIARDLAAAGIGTFKPVEVPAIEGEGACPVEVRIEDSEGCPAFHARVIRGVTDGASPEWMQKRLIDAGQRPISALVDCTNYLMLACGRPAHVYDLAKLSGPVVARRANDGETVEALKGKTYTLDDSMTVIADDEGVHDIGGIMGGEHSSVSDGTTDVLLEIAYFEPEAIGVTGRKLGLATDARTRFERGVDPEFLDDGLALLTDLIVKSCGGEPSEAVRVGETDTEWQVLGFDPDLTRTLGGIDIAEDEQRRILEALDFRVGTNKRAWDVWVPPRRHDIDNLPDLVEEVIRIHGLDKVESVALPRADGVARPTAIAEQKLERKVRRAAAARGLHEAVTWSFLPTDVAERFAEDSTQLWSLANPISEDMKTMRPSLLPGLLMAVQRNLDRGASALRLFELGRRYGRGKNGASDERLTLGAVLAGDKTPRGWATGKAQGFDAYDAKAEAMALLAAAGAPVDNLMVMGEAGGQWHPGQSGTLRLGPKNVLARFGMLHPRLTDSFDIDRPVAAVEIYLDALPKGRKSDFARPAYTPPALQAVTRDFAFLFDADKPASDLLRAVKGADKKHIVDAQIFDDFRGAGVPEGKRSLAIEVTLQPGEKSFTEDELKAMSDAITAAAAKQGGELRA